MAWVSITKSCYHGHSDGRTADPCDFHGTRVRGGAIPVRPRPVSLVRWSPMQNDGRNEENTVTCASCKVASIIRSDCYRLERQMPGGIRTR